MTTAAIDPVDYTKLAKVKADWTAAEGALKELPCEPTEEHMAWWKEKLSQVQDVVVALEAERQVLVRPLIDDKARLDKIFKEAAAAPERMKTLIKGKLAAAAEAALALQQAAHETARLAAQAGDHEAVALALESAPEVGGSFVWEIESVDVKVLPEEYWVVDYAKLEALAAESRKSEKPPAVPGVTFKRTARVSARRGKK
jgi:hypothetical protein